MLWRKCEGVVSTTRSCTARLREHLLAHLVCPGRHTVSALITVFGKQFQDWTADYSLYSKDRVDETVIFRQVRKEVETLGQAKRPLCLALDASTPRKPGKTAPPEAVQLYKEQMKQRNLNALAVEVLQALQQERSDENAGLAPALHVVVDGSYTNKKILRHLPANTTLIGRIRKDARLSAKPDAPRQATRGPKRICGDPLPTPGQIRQDDKIP